MVVRVARRLPFLAILATSVACAVTHPPGYAELTSEPATMIQATPGVMYGVAPRSWDLPDGRKITIDVERASVASGFGFYRANMAFAVSIGDAKRTLQCASFPERSDLPKTRFGCWDRSGETVFGFARGDACMARDAHALETMTTPECWTGVLEVGDTPYTIRYANTSSSKVVVDRVTWTDQDGHIMQAADIVAMQQIEVYRSKDIPLASSDTLLMHALALHQYSQILSM